LNREIDDQNDEMDLIDLLFEWCHNPSISSDEQISIYNRILFEICTNYVTLSNCSIDVFPTEVFEFVDLILDTMHENSYKESFLISLQFIYQDYLDCLGKGRPLLMSSKESSVLSSFQIVLDSHYKIIQFDTVNMDFIEQDKIMNKIVSMECKNQIGPNPKVFLHIRHDV